MALLFSLREFGATFATRGRGSELREIVLAQCVDQRVVIIDFAEVTNVSYSFADEFVGRLSAESSQELDVELANMTVPVDRIIRSAQQRRLDDVVRQ